jgi:hypothetical protein
VPRRLWTEEEILKATEMRLAGETYVAIGTELGRSFGSVSDKLKSRGVVYIKPLAPPKEISGALDKQVKVDRRLGRNDRRRNALDNLNEFEFDHTVTYPTRWPLGKEAITDPDEALSHSRGLIAGYIDQLARGALFENQPLAVVIALYIWMHSIPGWDPGWLRLNRSKWGSIRELARVGIEEAGRRVSVSGSSISRYEGLTRTPEAALVGRLLVAYRQFYIETLERMELNLAYLSYLDAEGTHTVELSDNGDSVPGIDTQAFLHWIDDGSNPWNTTENIAHLTHLARARSLIPLPEWRDADSASLFNLGYAILGTEEETPATVAHEGKDTTPIGAAP